MESTNPAELKNRGTIRKKWHQRRNDICFCQTAEEIKKHDDGGTYPRKFKNCHGKNFKPTYYTA